MGLSSEREYIDLIRRQKFGIGSTECNPLAGMLHEAIAHLSAELYQKDVHFILELLQNAEDNVYGSGVSPSLEIVLTTEDITKVGAQATLILFNNEVGFQRAHVEALCAVGLSTKKGKRDNGYIGEKGIGFKSVFLVTRTPHIISNGFRFRFTDEASNEARIGYVVPEWTDTPTDADLRRVHGKHDLPQTMIVLPLRSEKIKPVQDQLKQVAPETLLFLSKLRQLVVRDESNKSLYITRSDMSPAAKLDEMCKMAAVNLSVGSSGTHVSEGCDYQLLQQKFPVTQRVDQRKEVESWDITIAFPLRKRINPGHFSGDIYAFLPSYLVSGFPFVINADFLLVASRETLKFDSPWNKGILACVPAVFLSAFKLFLQESNFSRVGSPDPAVPVRDAYRYIPVEQPQQMELRKVQERVLNLLKNEDCVLVDAQLIAGSTAKLSAASGGVRNVFCKPEMARLIDPEFLSILVTAESMNPTVKNSQWYIVDSEVQHTYTKTLESLGVMQMTENEYIKCLTHEDWLLNLSEELYWDVVRFVLEHCRSSSDSPMRKIPILKLSGTIALASIEHAQRTDGVKIFLSPLDGGDWISKWTASFKPWIAVVFMPTETVRAFKALRQNSGSKRSEVWTFLLEVVPDFSVEQFLSSVFDMLSTANDPKFVFLATEFAYQCVQENFVELKAVSALYPSNFPIVNRSNSLTWIRRASKNPSILLPADGSFWPKLSLDSWSSQLVAMSDAYVSSKKDSLELETYRSFFRSFMAAYDIPELIPPEGASCSIPSRLCLNMTIEEAKMLLMWLTTLHPEVSSSKS